jgi:enamine deaminase RidA (YjgF/YER057c/UK114 family)
MKGIEDKLKGLGFGFNGLPKPGGSYVSVNIRANIAYVAIQFPIKNETFLYQGRLGGAVTTEDGYKAAELCAMNIVAQMATYVGLEKIKGLNHLDIYYQQTEDWDEGPLVADGASNLFLEMGNEGRHTRAIFGVAHLPRNFSVGITSSFTIG